MKRILSAIGAGIVATIIGLTSVVSSVAAPIAPTQVQVTSNVDQVQYREHRRPVIIERRRDGDGRRGWQRNDRRRPHYEERRARAGQWNGHRGYREQRRGYRRGGDGWWYPRQAFGRY